MGIQPIDLQTLYAQLEKVGKLQGEQQHALAAQLEKQQQANRADAEKRRSTVQKAETEDKQGTVINSEGGNGSQQFDQKDKKQTADTLPQKKDSAYIQDPALGRKIDVSG